MHVPSRRDFLKTTSLLAAALPLSLRADAASSTPAKEAKPGAKRGLFFNRDEIPRIRAALEEPRLAELRAKILDMDLEAETRFLRDKVNLRNHIQDMARVRVTLESTAFAHAITGDQRFLDVTRLAIGRLLYGMKYPDRVRGWTLDPAEGFPFEMDISRWPLILNATNLKVIPICALGMAGAWFQGRHPQADRWLDMSRQSARAFSTMFGLDGSYDEGVGYWGYTAMHLVMQAEVLYRLLGTDERNLINYPGTIRFALAMTMPTSGEPYTNPKEISVYNATPKGVIDPAADMVNFGDSGVRLDITPATWVAETHDDAVEDCAESPGSEYKGRPVGTWGDISILSFQHNKPVTAGEGGAVLTRDQRLYERAVRMSDLGQYRPYHQEIRAAREPAFSGGQYRLSELAAAVALAQWRKLPAVLKHCRALAKRILPRLATLPGVELRPLADAAGAFPFELYFFVRDEHRAAEVRRRLDARGVNCTQRTGTYPQYHRDYVKTGAAAHPAFAPSRGFDSWPAPGYRPEDFPRTEDLTRRFVALPLGWRYTEADADHIAASVEAVHAELS
ncbi:MAG: DegT/DnrJ/EryC1/StrS family aminotransferase [Opitutaceae bacterium]